MIVYSYLQLSRTFHWPPQVIDEMEIAIYFDYMIVAALTGEETGPDGPVDGFIDQIVF